MFYAPKGAGSVLVESEFREVLAMCLSAMQNFTRAETPLENETRPLR